MSSLRARLRAGPTTVDDEPFERWAATTRATDAGTPTMRPSGSGTKTMRGGNPRTPSASGGWNASTRVTPGDSARASGGERRRRRRASAWDGAREGDSPWIERDGSTRASTSNGRDVGGASAVKPTKTPRERLRVANLPDARRGRMSGERAERNDRDATMDCHRGGGGRVSKEKAKSSEDLDVEEEVLRILRDVVRETKAAHERAASAPCEAREAVEIKATDTVKARESRGVLSTARGSANPNMTRALGRRALVVFASFVFGAIHGRMNAPSVTAPRESEPHPSSVVQPDVVQPERASRLRLDDDVLHASWLADLDRARVVHDTAADDTIRRRVRIAAKRARDARKDALALAEETSTDAVLLADSACRAVRAFADLRRAVDADADAPPSTSA